MWQGLAAYFALVAFRVILNYSSLRNYLRLPLILPTKEEPADWPSVSVIVPVAQGGQSLSALLRSLKGLDYPRMEILVVDATGEAAAAVQQGTGRVIQPGETPPGWSQTNFCCWRGAQEASSEWLLFTEAGTVHQPQSLRRVMAQALRDHLQALSLFIQQRCLSFWERVLLPYAFQQYFAGVPRARVNAPQDPAALGNEQYFLIRRDVYFEIGGHERLKDAAWATRLMAALKGQAVPALVGRGEFQASARMFSDFGSVWGGMPRLWFSLLGKRGGLTLISTALSGLAIACAVFGLATRSLPFELAALVTYLASVVELVVWQFLFQTPLQYALFQPIAFVIFASRVLLREPQRSPAKKS